ncbi:hypothetical protein OQA88_4173 [Cercophora sp. LCS_1]
MWPLILSILLALTHATPVPNSALAQDASLENGGIIDKFDHVVDKVGDRIERIQDKRNQKPPRKGPLICIGISVCDPITVDKSNHTNGPAPGPVNNGGPRPMEQQRKPKPNPMHHEETTPRTPIPEEEPMSDDYEQSGDHYGYGGGGDYDEGYTNGYNNGYNTGYSGGYTSGHQTGYDSGYRNGFGNGQSQGHEEAYNQGYNSGYNNAYSNNKYEQYGSGYSDGYNDGWTDGSSRVYGGYQDTRRYGNRKSWDRSSGYGNGYGNEYGNGYSNGYGNGYGNEYGNGYSNGYGNGYGNQYGNGYNERGYGRGYDRWDQLGWGGRGGRRSAEPNWGWSQDGY